MQFNGVIIIHDTLAKRRGYSMLKRLLREEEGQTLVEYGLILALIAVVVIAVLYALGQKVRNVFITINNHIITSA